MSLFYLLIIILLALYVDQFVLRLNLTSHTEPWVDHYHQQLSPLLASDVERRSTTDPKTAGNDERTRTQQPPLEIAFLTWGSRGDLQPNLALGAELARRGHRVTVAGTEQYRTVVERYPEIGFAPVRDPHLPAFSQCAADADGSGFLSCFSTYLNEASSDLVAQYMALARDADVLVGQVLGMALLPHLTVAEATQKPLVLIAADPVVPTSEYSFNMDERRSRDYGRRLNVLTHRMLGWFMGISMTFGRNATYRRIRADLGLTTPWPFYASYASPESLADFPILDTTDPCLWPQPGDHPPHWIKTGYFLVRGTEETINGTDQSLQLWIDERKALQRTIIYFGQGSLGVHNQEIYMDILLDTMQSLDVDAIVLGQVPTSSSSGKKIDKPNLKELAEVDHSRIFPQMDVIVHHGGAGTASQCIRSGRPGVCLPGVPFQEVWCAKLVEQGAGVMVLPDDLKSRWLQQPSVNVLTQSIRKALEPPMAAAAKHLQQLSGRLTGGVELAGDAIESLQQTKRAALQSTSRAAKRRKGSDDEKIEL